MADLSILRFEVDDEPLKAAQEKVEALAKALDKVADANDRVEKSEADKSKVTKSSGDVAQAAYEKFIDGALGGVGALDKLLKKQQDTLSFMQTGFSKGQSSVLAFAKSLGASTDELTKLSDILDKQRALLGGETFDKSIGGLKSLQREVDLARKANASFNQEGALTRKQLSELARDVERVSQQYKEQGKSATELQSAITKLTTDYKDAAAALRVEENAIKAKQAAQDQLLQSTERQISAQRQLRVEQEKNALIKQGFSSSAANTGANLLVDGVDRNLVGQILAQKKATDDLIASQRASAAAAKGIGAASEQAGDAAVKAFLKARQEQERFSDKAQDSLSKLRSQLDFLQNGASTTRAAANALSEYGANLRAAGASADVLKAKMQEFAAVQKDIATELRRVNIADTLKNIFLGGGIVGAAITAIQTVKQLGFAFIETTDKITNLSGRLSILSNGTIDFGKQFQDLVDIASRSRVPLDGVNTLFARLVPIMPTLGKGVKDAAVVTESFSKLLLISGASASEAGSALLQFSQALGKGKLDGDEFRSVAEATPEVLRLLERELNVSRAALFKMSEEGKITASVLVDVLSKAAKGLDEQMKGLPVTFSQATTIMKNEIVGLIQVMTDAEKGTGALATGVLFLADVTKAFKDILKQSSSELNNTSGEFDAFGLALAGIGTIVETSILLMSDLIFVVKGIGSSLGGLAAIAANPTQFSAIWEAMGERNRQAETDLKAFQDRVANLSSDAYKKLLERQKAENAKLLENQRKYGKEQIELIANPYTEGLTAAAKGLKNEETLLTAHNSKITALTQGLAKELIDIKNDQIRAQAVINNQGTAEEKAQAKADYERGTKEALERTKSFNNLRLVAEKDYQKELAKLNNQGTKGRSVSFAAATPDNTISELQKQFAIQLQELQKAGKAEEQVLRSQLENRIITKGEYAIKEIDLTRKTTQELLSAQTERETALLAAYTAEENRLKSQFESERKRLAGKKGFAEAEAKAKKDLEAALANLDNKYKTAAESAEAFRKAIQSDAEVRQVKAINDLAKGLSDLSDKYTEITRSQKELNDQRDRQVQIEDQTRFASPEQAASIKAYAEEFDRLTSALSKLQVESNSVNREVEILLAKFADTAPTDAQYKALEQLLEVQEKLNKAISEAPDPAVEAQKRAVAALDKIRKDEEAKLINGVADAIETGLFEGGKAGRKKLRDLIVAELRKPITVFIQASVRTLLDSVGITNTGSSGAGLGEISSIFDKASKAFDAFTSFNSNVATKIASGLESLAAKLISSNSPFLQNLGSKFSDSFISGASQIGGAIVGAFASVGISGAISGGFKTGVDGLVKAATVVGGAIYGPIAGVVAGVFNRAFGRKLADVGVQGTFNNDGFEGNSFQFLKGGLFRSDKTVLAELDNAVKKQLGDAFKNIQIQTALFAESLGFSADGIADFTASIKVSTKGLTDEQIAEAFNAELLKISDQLVAATVDLTGFEREGETLTQTLARMAGSLQNVNSTFELLNITLLDASLSGADAASSLIDLFGGVEEFSRSTSSYYQNFFTEAERTANSVEALRQQFVRLNEAGTFSGTADAFQEFVINPTRESFRQLIEAQDANTESGRLAIAELLKLSDAFASVVPAADQAASALSRASEAFGAVNTNTGIRARTEEEAIAAADRRDRLQAERALQSQVKSTAEEVKTFTDSLGNTADTLQQLIDLNLRAGRSIEAFGILFEDTFTNALRGLTAQQRNAILNSDDPQNKILVAQQQIRVANELISDLSRNALRTVNVTKALSDIESQLFYAVSTIQESTAELAANELGETLSNILESTIGIIASNAISFAGAYQGGPGVAGIRNTRLDIAQAQTNSNSSIIIGRTNEQIRELNNLAYAFQQGIVSTEEYAEAIDYVSTALGSTATDVAGLVTELQGVSEAASAGAYALSPEDIARQFADLYNSGVSSAKYYFSEMAKAVEGFNSVASDVAPAMDAVTDAIGRLQSAADVFKESADAIEEGINGGFGDFIQRGPNGEGTLNDPTLISSRLISEAAQRLADIVTTRTANEASQVFTASGLFDDVTSPDAIREALSAFTAGLEDVRRAKEEYDSLSLQSTRFAIPPEQISAALNRFQEALRNAASPLQDFDLGVDSLNSQLESLVASFVNNSNGVFNQAQQEIVSRITGLLGTAASDASRTLTARDAGLLVQDVAAFDTEGLERTFLRLSEALSSGRINAEQFAELLEYSEAVYLGAANAADLLGDSVAGVDTNLRTAAEIANERTRLENELLQLQGNTVEIRNREREALDESNRALYDQIQALRDQQEAAAEAARIASEREGLERRLLQVQGDTEAIRRLEIEALDESNRAILRQIFALEDAAQAAAEAQRAEEELASQRERIENERLGLENRLLQLQGNTAELRNRELLSLDESNRAILQQIFALEDAKEAEERLTQARTEAESALQQAFDAEIQRLDEIIAKRDQAADNLQSAYDRESSVFNDAISKFKDFSKSLREFISSLNKDALSPQDNLNQLRGNFAETIRKALAGDEEAIGAIPNIGASLAEQVRENARTREDLVRELANIQISTDGVAEFTLNQVSVAQQQLDALNLQVQGLLKVDESVLSVADAVAALYTAEQAAADAEVRKADLTTQVEALLGVNTSVLSVEEAIRNLIDVSIQVGTNIAGALGSRFDVNNPNGRPTGQPTQPVNQLPPDFRFSTQEERTQLIQSLGGIPQSLGVNRNLGYDPDAGYRLRIAPDPTDGVTGNFGSFRTVSVQEFVNSEFFDAIAANSAIGNLTSLAVNQISSSNFLNSPQGQAERQAIIDSVNSDIRVIQDALSARVVPGFAEGGFYPGGLAIVGEEGPEMINFNRPGQVYTAGQTAEMLSGSSDSSDTAQAIRELQADMKSAMFYIAKYTQRTADRLDRWDGDGLPMERVD